MKIKKTLSLLTIISLSLLHSSGCSNAGENEDIRHEQTAAGIQFVIYEANPKVFATSGALSAITARLDEIKALGTDILWLMPVYEQGELKSVGSPYCVKDYRKINPEYGTDADLKELVETAHSKGMKVILDWVANHTAWDNGWIQNKDWYTQDAGGNIISPEGTNWNDVADLNYSNTEMRQAMKDAMKYWISEFDIDGYRCDYAEGVPGDFWTDACAELRKIKGEELVMLGEGSLSSLYEYGFDIVYSWNFSDWVKELFDGKSTMSGLLANHNSDIAGVPEGACRMRYITNHDQASETSPVIKFKNADGALAAFVITSMMSDCIMIYSSQEIGYDKSLSFFTYHVMDWDGNPEYLGKYKKYMEIYKSSSEARRGSMKVYETGDMASIFHENGSEKLLTAVNTKSTAIQAKMPMELSGSTMTNVLTGQQEKIPVTLDLQPYQYIIWKTE